MARLEHCPNEVIETILSLLALNDIRNFRQTSRRLSLKSTGHHFKSYFRLKHVDLTERALQDFVEATKPGQLGCLVQDLVLVGVMYNTKLLNAIVSYGRQDTEQQAKALHNLGVLMQLQADHKEFHETGMDIRLLSEAFGNLMANSKDGKLRSLSLAVVVYREDAEQRLSPATGGGWKLIWQAAADTTHTALRSLKTGGLPVQKLNMYNHEDRCSLACDELSELDFESEGLATSLASLKALSVSFSDKIIEITKGNIGDTGDSADEVDWDAANDERTISDIESEAGDMTNFIGLCHLLRRSSQLEHLELHHYHLDTQSLVGAELHHERFMQHMAGTVKLPNLKRCTLRGLSVREVDLLAFIQGATTIRELSLQNVDLVSGTFRSIFDYCTSETASLERLHFDDLFERGMIYFEGPGKPKYRGMDRPSSNTLDRAGPEIRKFISYCVPGDTFPANPWFYEWKGQHRKEYGPP